MLDYDSHYKEYLVQKVNSAGRVVDENGQPVVNGGLGPDGQCLVIVILLFFPHFFGGVNLCACIFPSCVFMCV